MPRRSSARARGGGPTVIEALTYRLSDHTTSDDATRYRGAAEVEAARRLEPMARLRAFLDASRSVGRCRRAGAASAMQRSSRRGREAVPGTPKQSTDAMFDLSLRADCRSVCARSARRRAVTAALTLDSTEDRLDGEDDDGRGHQHGARLGDGARPVGRRAGRRRRHQRRRVSRHGRAAAALRRRRACRTPRWPKA